MARIIRYIGIVVTISFVIYITPILFFGFLYSHGAGGPGKIERYEFKTANENVDKSLKTINCKAYIISIKDIALGDSLDSKNKIYDNLLMRIQIKNKKTSEIITDTTSFSESYNQNHSRFNLIYINGKSDDDFWWFSIEKYKKVKLFEEAIIEPLSKKIERIELD